jgi:hypothetical protein
VGSDGQVVLVALPPQQHLQQLQHQQRSSRACVLALWCRWHGVPTQHVLPLSNGQRERVCTLVWNGPYRAPP